MRLGGGAFGEGSAAVVRALKPRTAHDSTARRCQMRASSTTRLESCSANMREEVPVSQRRLRADAQRNVDALLEAAETVFAGSGVEAPAKEIADIAGVGVGTLYRHFPGCAD